MADDNSATVGAFASIENPAPRKGVTSHLLINLISLSNPMQNLNKILFITEIQCYFFGKAENVLLYNGAKIINFCDSDVKY